jgi:uncharacterized protein YbjT (DUF2867 family)
MILVTCAHGNQGRILIPKLRDAGLHVRALRVTPGRETELRDLGADEVIVGDASDRSFLRQAVQGVDTIYHIGPSAHPLEREMGFAMVDVAREAEVGHMIFSSVLHAVVSKLIQHKAKRDVEEYIIESGINFTILQPSDYMLPLLLRPAFETGTFELSWDLNRQQSMIDLHDVAEVVVKVAQEGKAHYGATYELTAPGGHSAHDIAAALKAATGRPIAVRQITPDAYLNTFYGPEVREGFRHQYGVFRAISLWYSQYDFVGNPNVLTWLLGRRPTTLEEFVAREWNAYGTPHATGR